MISVCMTTYNGENYVRKQIESILEQLEESDEVIICDDKSQDRTTAVIRSIPDPRIRLIENETNLGYVGNFLKAIGHSQGDVVFLSDQDDIWIPGRKDLMMSELEDSGKSVVVGNFNYIIDGEVEVHDVSPSLSEKYNHNYRGNLLRIFKGGIPYFGCCMAFNKDFKELLLEKAQLNISHDIMIALIANKKHEIHHVSEPVLTRIIHGANVTSSNRKLSQKIKTRIDWLCFLIRV